MSEESKAYSKQYYQENRERLLAEQKVRESKKDPAAKRAYRRAYYAANRDRLLAEQRERGRRNYRANPVPYAVRQRRSRLKKYGLTEAQFHDMWEKTKGYCPICDRPMVRSAIAIDHDHETGQVRGIICRNCNTAMGLFREDPNVMEEAADYLRRWSSGATSMPSSLPLKTLFDPVD